MSETAMVAFYLSDPGRDVTERVREICEDIGFEIEGRTDRKHRGPDIELRYDIWTTTLRFGFSEDREPNEPTLTIGPLNDQVDPSHVRDDETCQQRMDVIFEMICRLSVALEAEYVPLIGVGYRVGHVVPTGRPIGNHVKHPPRLGVYSTSMLDEFGGLDTLFDSQPWYVGILDSQRTLVIQTASPWTDAGWRPPTEATFIEDATFHEGETTATPSLQDPFAGLNVGNYGVDVAVRREDIGDRFRNEDLELGRNIPESEVPDSIGRVAKESSEVDVTVTGQVTVNGKTLDSPAVESKHFNPDKRPLDEMVDSDIRGLKEKLTTQAAAGEDEIIVVTTREYYDAYEGRLNDVPDDVKSTLDANDVDSDVTIEITTYQDLRS